MDSYSANLCCSRVNCIHFSYRSEKNKDVNFHYPCSQNLRNLSTDPGLEPLLLYNNKDVSTRNTILWDDRPLPSARDKLLFLIKGRSKMKTFPAGSHGGQYFSQNIISPVSFLLIFMGLYSRKWKRKCSAPQHSCVLWFSSLGVSRGHVVSNLGYVSLFLCQW